MTPALRGRCPTSTSTNYGYTTQSALASLGHNLTGTAQDITQTYIRNQAQEIASHSWNNDLYQWVGYTVSVRRTHLPIADRGHANSFH